MYDRVRLLDLIEGAQDSEPYCLCYAPTEIADEDGSIVLRCKTATSPTGLLDRIGAVILPHTHRVVVDREELLAA